ILEIALLYDLAGVRHAPHRSRFHSRVPRSSPIFAAWGSFQKRSDHGDPATGKVAHAAFHHRRARGLRTSIPAPYGTGEKRTAFTPELTRSTPNADTGGRLCTASFILSAWWSSSWQSYLSSAFAEDSIARILSNPRN